VADILLGCDFSSAPTSRKPIVIALGSHHKGRVQLAKLEYIDSLDAFEAWLQQPANWIGAFDFPFSLPRELVEHLGWPLEWPALITHYASMSRAMYLQAPAHR
jgi:hypothetical protein